MADYNKPKKWNGKDLKGFWEFTTKKDGIRTFIKDGVATSRADKPLYNLDGLPDGDYELFVDDWNTSVSRVRTQDGEPLSVDDLYSIDPLDLRLHRGVLNNPTAEEIKEVLAEVLAEGDEGLVLRQDDRWIKVKPKETYDVEVTSLQLGTGKYAGMLGAFVTSKGNVGSGLSDQQRKDLLLLPKGTIIEVECMSLTKDGKFRHPVFKRVRWDKNEQSNQ